MTSGPKLRRAILAILVLLPIVVWLLVARWERRPEIVGDDAVRISHTLAVEVGRTPPESLPGRDTGWRPSVLPDNWDGNRTGYEGYVWYRLADAPALSRFRRPVIYLPAVGMNADIRVNGHHLASPGRMTPPVSRYHYTPKLISIPPTMARRDGRPDEVLVLVYGYPGYRSGLGTVWIGEHDALHGAWRQRTHLQNTGTLLTSVLNGAIGIFVLLIWWRERSHVAHAWFGLAALVWGTRNLVLYVVEPPLPDLLWAELTVTGAVTFTGLFAMFAMRFAEQELPGYRAPRWLPSFIAVYVAICAVHFLSAPSYQSANAGFAALAIVGILLTAWSQWRLIELAWRRPEAPLIAVAAGAAFYLILLIRDYAIGTDKQSLGEIYLRQYATLPLFVAITATLASRYLIALARARELTSTLQSKIDEQRRLLEQSFVKLRIVERDRELATERARLMGELHDGVGLHLITALHQIRTADASRDSVAGTLQDCLDDLRVAIDSLDSLGRDPVSLLGSLRYRMAPRFKSFGVTMEWEVDSSLDTLAPLDADQALDLLRIVQESLTNALKHSGATTVRMAIAGRPDGFEVIVADNGRGFEGDLPATGKGRAQMAARARRLGARLSIDGGGPGGRGCTVRLSLPMARSPDVSDGPAALR